MFLLAAAAPAAADVTIDDTNFPDKAFRNYVKDNCDSDDNFAERNIFLVYSQFKYAPADCRAGQQLVALYPACKLFKPRAKAQQGKTQPKPAE